MEAEKNLDTLLKTMKPKHHEGEYVFCVLNELSKIHIEDAVLLFREEEGISIIVKKELADRLGLKYTFIASWITLTVHSSLEAVGLTAAFSAALSKEGISCNVVAAFYHDHIFVNSKDTERAMAVLNNFSA